MDISSIEPVPAAPPPPPMQRLRSIFRILKDDMRRDPLRSTHTECVNDLSSGARGGLVVSVVGGFDLRHEALLWFGWW